MEMELAEVLRVCRREVLYLVVGKVWRDVRKWTSTTWRALGRMAR